MTTMGHQQIARFLMSMTITHILLPAFAQKTFFPYTDPPQAAWHQEMVDVHHRLRQGVSPGAANIRRMAFNQTLADLAVEAAKRCDFMHSWSENKIEKYKGYGEVIFKGSHNTPEQLMMGWFRERNYYTFNDIYKSDNCVKGKVCGHYKSITAYPISQVGCGYKSCKDTYVYVYCLYDRGQRTPPYNSGPECSACEDIVSRCVDGLCTPNADTAAGGKYNSKQSCELICRNCGTRLPGADQCGCTCPEGTSGAVCMEGTPPANCTSMCSKLGRKCLNGGTELNVTGATTCKCQCPDAYTGEFCQTSKLEAVFGVTYKLGGLLYSSNIFPITKFEYRDTLAAQINAEIAAKVNKDCATDAFYKSCCPKATAVPTNPVLTAANIKTISGYPYSLLDGNLLVGIFAAVTSSSCPGTTYLPQTVFKNLAEAALSNSTFLKTKTFTAIDVSIAYNGTYVPPIGPGGLSTTAPGGLSTTAPGGLSTTAPGSLSTTAPGGLGTTFNASLTSWIVAGVAILMLLLLQG